MKIFYSVEDISPGEMLPIVDRTRTPIEFYNVIEDEYVLENLVRNAAKDYHHNHGGWEHSSWPIEIKLYDEDEKVLGTFSVDRDVEPVFFARKIK
jgi:hypothetical protein